MTYHETNKAARKGRPVSTGIGEHISVYVPRELYLRMIRAMADDGTRHRNAFLNDAIRAYCERVELNVMLGIELDKQFNEGGGK